MTSTVRLPTGLAPAGPRTVPLRIAFGRNGFGRGVDGRHAATAGAETQQRHKRAENPKGGNAVRAVERSYRQAMSSSAEYAIAGPLRAPAGLDDVFARQWRRRRCVVENNRTPIAVQVPHECRAPSRLPPRADRGTNNRCENSVASCAQSVLLPRRENATQVPRNSRPIARECSAGLQASQPADRDSRECSAGLQASQPAVSRPEGRHYNPDPKERHIRIQPALRLA